MLEIVPSNQFRKDLKLARKRGLKIERLKEVVNILAEQKKLEDKYRDHGLSGEYKGFRECHIEPDWLLVYRIDEDVLSRHAFIASAESPVSVRLYPSHRYT